jgi:hypothetical protein
MATPRRYLGWFLQFMGLQTVLDWVSAGVGLIATVALTLTGFIQSWTTAQQAVFLVGFFRVVTGAIAGVWNSRWRRSLWRMASGVLSFHVIGDLPKAQIKTIPSPGLILLDYLGRAKSQVRPGFGDADLQPKGNGERDHTFLLDLKAMPYVLIEVELRVGTGIWKTGYGTRLFVIGISQSILGEGFKRLDLGGRGPLQIDLTENGAILELYVVEEGTDELPYGSDCLVYLRFHCIDSPVIVRHTVVRRT